MKKLRYHLDNLESQLRDKGIFDFSEVEFAVLEPHGQLSVLKKSQHLPLTPKDMNMKTKCNLKYIQKVKVNEDQIK